MFWSFPLSVAVAYLVGMAVAYSLNRVFVFPGSKRPILEHSIEFAVINLAFLPVVWSAALLLKKSLLQLGMTRFVEGIAHALALAVTMFVTFLIYKLRTFRMD